MIPVERQRTIMRVLARQGSATIPELVDLLDVSHMTVRRDIATLEGLGRVSSVAKGVTLPSRVNLDLAHAAKTELHREQKAGIARIAAGLVHPRDVVFLDAGTTTLALCRELAPREDLVVVTNDLVIARTLAETSGSQLHLASGAVDKANLSTEGGSTADAISGFNFDIAFLSTPAFDLRGTSIQSEAKKVVKDAATRHARTSVLVADSSKYGRVMPLTSVPVARFDAIVTDRDLSGTAQASLREAGVQLHLTA